MENYVLDPSGYREMGDNCKTKSRLYPHEIAVSDADWGRSKVYIDEKQVVFYSATYDRRARADREPALLEARDLVNNPSKNNKAMFYGAAKYVKNLFFDSKMSEIVTTKQRPRYLMKINCVLQQ